MNGKRAVAGAVIAALAAVGGAATPISRCFLLAA